MKIFKTIQFYAKTADRFAAVFTDVKGNTFETDGYPPKFLDKYCDGVNLEIDLETGQILNWKKPSDEDIEEYIEKNN